MEFVTHPGPSAFLTLTYNDENVPETDDGHLTLRKKETLKWVDHTSQRIQAFRYYIVGEYGEESLRPHYHLAVFLPPDGTVGKITEAWQRGYTSAYPLTRERAAYLARYTTKKLTSDTDPRLKPDQEPEFRSSSKRPALGAAFVSSLVRAYRTRPGQKLIESRGDIEPTVRISGKIYPIPEYIRRHARQHLGIPLLHRDRICHDGYDIHHAGRELAERDFDKALAEELKYNAKEKALKLRYSTKTI